MSDHAIPAAERSALVTYIAGNRLSVVGGVLCVLLVLIAILESTARRKLAELKVPAGCVDKDTIVNPERNQNVGRNP